MIAKKNSKYDFERKRVMLLQAGLLTAGSFTLAAFTYKAPITETDEYRTFGKSDLTFELIEVDTPEPEPIETIAQAEPITLQIDLPPQIDEDLNEKENSSTSVSSSTSATYEGSEEFKIGDFNPGTKKVEGEIFEWVEKEPEYIGGYIAMQHYIVGKQNYPQTAIDMGEEGTVHVSFIVEADGSISNVHAVNGVSKALDREAERIVKAFPKWIPGEINYSPVRTRMNLPIKFILEK